MDIHPVGYQFLAHRLPPQTSTNGGVLFRQAVFPEDIWDLDDPSAFWLVEDGHGM